jgi:hypothetical protein
MAQFLSESIILSIVSLIVAYALLETCLPIFNSFVGKELNVGSEEVYLLIPISAGMIILSGFLAGIYPAMIISSFSPARILKGLSNSIPKRTVLRKILVVAQFTVSIALILGTIVIFKQLDYIKGKDVGYQKDHVVKIDMKGESGNYYNILKEKLLQNENVLSITGMYAGLPYWSMSTSALDWDGKDADENVLAHFDVIDYDFVKTLNINLAEGRDFSREHPLDESTGYLINEKMAETMGLDGAVGADLKVWENQGQIIGVVKDFHFRPLQAEISPLVLMLSPERIQSMLIRIKPQDISSTVQAVEEAWVQIIPTFPFVFSFLTDDFNQGYSGVKKMGDYVGLFSFLAIFIACIGMFGLASLTAEQRTKEIGIRKVLGATIFGIVQLITREFLFLVLLANLFAWPVAFYLMTRWLEGFAYHIDIGVGDFIMAGVLALLIAIMTIGVRSVRAALANPVKTLRYE